jgi:thiosulfate reductase cytochrome b subunit
VGELCCAQPVHLPLPPSGGNQSRKHRSNRKSPLSKGAMRSRPRVVGIEKKHPLAIRWFHWLNFPLLAVMIWSGLLIYWANDVYGVRLGGHEVVKLLPPINGADPYAPNAPQWWPKSWTEAKDAADPQSARLLYKLEYRLAEGMGWHFLFMWLFTVNGVLYVLYTSLSGEWRHLVPKKGTLKHAFQTVLHDLHIRKVPPSRQKFNGAQQIAYTSIIVMGLGSVLTGIVVYKPTQAAWLTALMGGYSVARFLHFWLMVGYVLFFLVHVAQVARAGWNNFRAMVTGRELVTADVGAEPAPAYPGGQ